VPFSFIESYETARRLSSNPTGRPAGCLDLQQTRVYRAKNMALARVAPRSPGRALRRFYRRLYRHFGPQRWWPARTRFEVILGALLTQNTSWANVRRALANLRRARALAPQKLASVLARRLSRWLRPSGYYRQKTRAVRAFLRHLQRRHAGSLTRLLRRPADALRSELLSLRGIGEETADSILLYAAGRPVFVIDAYTRRILSRHGLMPETAPYADLQDFFHRQLPRDAALFNEYHALLVAAGKTYCHRQNPDCPRCPLGIELEPARAR